MLSIKNMTIECWQCPICPNVYKRQNFFEPHLQNIHNINPENVLDSCRVSYTKEQVDQKQHDAAIALKAIKEHESSFSESVQKSNWGPKAFSSRFPCKFCGEVFSKESSIIVHLKLNHNEESKASVAQALGNVSDLKLDGCVYQCKICQRKFNTSNSFLRHTRDMHKLTLKEYQAEHGSAEVISGVFACKLCGKNIKHTRNIVTAHMKLVHSISWQSYVNMIATQEDATKVLIKSINSPDMFECAICGNRVKLKRQHLSKTHNMEEDVYNSTYDKFFMSSSRVPEVISCKLCQKTCIDLGNHLKFSHKMTMEEYHLQPVDETLSSDKQQSSKSSTFSCYFQCIELFRTESDLLAHIDIKHSKESQEDLAKAKEEALNNTQIKRPSSQYLCEICNSIYSSRSSFWCHLKRKHTMSIKDYENEFGPLKSASSSIFKCIMCSKEIRNERSSIRSHMKNVHYLDWEEYVKIAMDIKSGLSDLSRVIPGSPTIESCKFCNVKVKGLKQHVKRVHQMSLDEYFTINVQLKDDESTAIKRNQPEEFTGLRDDIIKEEPSIINQSGEELFNDETVFYPSAGEKQARSIETWENSERSGKLLLREFNEPYMKSVQRDNHRKLASMIDVTNKSLKSCKKCNIDFISRKGFIEHCQVVHHMRFKLKNGQRLPPPLVKN